MIRETIPPAVIWLHFKPPIVDLGTMWSQYVSFLRLRFTFSIHFPPSLSISAGRQKIHNHTLVMLHVLWHRLVKKLRLSCTCLFIIIIPGDSIPLRHFLEQNTSISWSKTVSCCSHNTNASFLHSNSVKETWIWYKKIPKQQPNITKTSTLEHVRESAILLEEGRESVKDRTT